MNIKLIRWLIVFSLCISASGQIKLNQQVITEPITDNAMRLSLSEDKQMLTVKLKLFDGKKGVPRFLMKTKSNNGEISQVAIFEEQLNKAEIKRDPPSQTITISLRVNDILNAAKINGGNVSFTSEDITVFREAWTPLYYNKQCCLCVIDSNLVKTSAAFEIVYEEIRYGTVMFTWQEDGILQTEETVKNKK
jgi:hypothetical protein